MEDIRHWDCTMIGELHDVPIATILSNFSGGSRKRASRLREIYSNANQEELYRQYSNLTTERINNLDFLIPGEDHLCRESPMLEKQGSTVKTFR